MVVGRGGCGSRGCGSNVDGCGSRGRGGRRGYEGNLNAGYSSVRLMITKLYSAYA